jgi:hypothetical protein
MKAMISRKTFYITVAVLAVIIVWLSSAVARLEAFHYSVQTGGCGAISENPVERMKALDCLDKEKPRTSPLYDILYGLNVL